MPWEIAIALVIAIPIILLAACIWYLNNSGVYAVIKEGGVTQATRKKDSKTKKKILQGQDYMDTLAKAHKPYPFY
jgi:hypothetical protein